MNSQPESVIITAMQQRSMPMWNKQQKKQSILKKPLGYLGIAAFCLSVGAYAIARTTNAEQDVLSVMSTGFEYDETLGRLQYVSSILPESAMVFLSSDTSVPEFVCPAETVPSHTWTQSEPWIEYNTGSVICACEDGEVMTIVENRNNEFTVRILHNDGYESVYSGLTALDIHAGSNISAGETIGYANTASSFELRKDGLSVLPVFSSGGGQR